MGARLLTPAEVRDALGAKVDGFSDDELIEIARRIRVVTSVFRAEWSARRAHVPPADVSSVTF